ncbi:unnamed protein product [Sphagnum compactum]
MAGTLLRRLDAEFLGDFDGGDSRPTVLSWYPGGLAWQAPAGRGELRKDASFAKLHSFLVKETQTGNICRQEAVSMVPPLFLDVEESNYILDMCAAPGSKTCQLVELMHQDACRKGKTLPCGVVVANDVDHDRASMMVHQVKRLNSPCLVSLGLQPLQLSILERGLNLLKPGGRLVYSTCSLNPVENEAVVSTALLRADGKIVLEDVSSLFPSLLRRPGMKCWKHGPEIPSAHNIERCMRFLPHLQNTGGFFVAVLKKIEGEENIPPIQSCQNEPFFLLDSSASPLVKEIYSHWQLSLSADHLLIRDVGGHARPPVSLVTEGCRLLVFGAGRGHSIIYAGVAAFSRCSAAGEGDSYRIKHNAVTHLIPFISRNTLPITEQEDLLKLLTEGETPTFSEISSGLSEDISKLGFGLSSCRMERRAMF